MNENQTTVSMDKDTQKLLRAISAKVCLSQSQLLEDFVKALYQLLSEGLEETHRISLTNWEIDLAKSTIRINATPIFSLHELPSELRNEVLTAFGYSTDGRFTDLREKKTDVDPIQQKPQPNPEKESE
jgi:hypothetical protein